MAKPNTSATAQADADAEAYRHGSMEINEQKATFALFIGLTKWGALATAVLLLFLTLWFHPGGNLIAALLGAVVLSVAGFFALKSKPAH